MMPLMDKHFVSEETHLLDGYRLGTQIYASGFRPTFIVGLWRGGAVVGMVVQECLATLGVPTDHITLRTSYRGRAEYESTLKGERDIRVHGKQYLLETMNAEDSLLIVDDVYSSGRHTQAVVDSLRSGLKKNFPEDVRVASVWLRKSGASRAETRPDFVVHETDRWIVLPFEVNDLTPEEIKTHRPYLEALLTS